MKGPGTRGVLQQMEELGRAMTDIIPFAMSCYRNMWGGTIEIDALKLTPDYKERLRKAFDVLRANMDSIMAQASQETVTANFALDLDDPRNTRPIPDDGGGGE